MNQQVRQQLAPTGVLRTAVNMANFLLITGETDSGEPDGVSPDLARAIAAELGIEAKMIPYKGPGEVADAIKDNTWDIGNIAAEPERAKTISFSPAYCEIQATYMVPPDSPLTDITQVDASGNRIAVKARAAYDLWLTEHLKHASLVRVDTVDQSFEIFSADKLEVLAGLRPALLKQQQNMPGARIFDCSFTAVQQSIGCRPKHTHAAAFLDEFIKNAISNGLIASLIEKHGVKGKLSVAPLAQ
ncbi:ABC transporter substrate-binding protein [Chromatiales bacterium (ex Bugula neritina AB1)]|nr:ABC transporter substrate-binding protein [Chromatiales bacterium (ex Bugula neritina AB1)]